MRRLLMITTALVGIALAEPAEAAPVGAWVAGAILGAGAAGTASFAIISGVVQLGLSIGVSALAAAIRGKPKQESVRTELTRPTSLPPWRFVYGHTWAPGSPVGWTVVGRSLYICYLLNSRPSAGPFTVYLDKRRVDLTGDPYDFSGGGANGTNWPFNSGSSGPHVWIWIGKGDQTKCPDYIVENTDGYFSASDAWRGRTVMWARFRLGSDDDRAERWPATPPEVNLEGDWSLLYDPRDGQTRFSRNQALAVLDALRNNPLRPYGDQYLRMDTFAHAADVADQAVAVKGGGTIPRYRADGVLVFGEGSELEDQVQPLLDAGASEFTRIGGRLGIIPAIARPSVKTITDLTDGQPPEFVRWKPSDDLYTEAMARYPAPDRAYESAETPLYKVPGAQAADGGIAKRLQLELDFVSDHRQAQRLTKIAAWRSRMQRGLSSELFPDAFDLVAGSICTLQLGFPFGPWDGKYKVDGITPAAGLNDEESITIRLPVRVTEHADAIYDWNAAAEEQDVEPGEFDGTISQIKPPVAVTVSTGSTAAQQSGDTVIAGVLGAWNASPSASTRSYEYRWGEYRWSDDTQSGYWRYGPIGTVEADEAGDAGVFSVIRQWPNIGDDYRLQVRAVGTYGRSGWVTSDPIEAAGPVDSIDVPQDIQAVPHAQSRINVTAVQTADTKARELLIYVNTVDSPLTATLQWTVPAGASVTVTRAHTGLTSGSTRYYFARARDQWGNLSGFTDSASATTA